jgi:hypothetical protein
MKCCAVMTQQWLQVVQVVQKQPCAVACWMRGPGGTHADLVAVSVPVREQPEVKAIRGHARRLRKHLAAAGDGLEAAAVLTAEEEENAAHEMCDKCGVTTAPHEPEIVIAAMSNASHPLDCSHTSEQTDRQAPLPAIPPARGHAHAPRLHPSTHAPRSPSV